MVIRQRQNASQDEFVLGSAPEMARNRDRIGGNVEGAPPNRFRRLRPFATRFLNPVTRLFAGWMPGFALLTYTGRKTGRTYHTPISVFRRGNHYVFALTFGSESQWVKNVLAAGGCQMRRMGRDIRLVEPELIVDPDARLVPQPLRFMGRLGRVTEFVRMRAA